MKAGIASSVVLHAALIGFGLVSLSAPPPLEVADIEAFPVDIIPIEEISQVQQGDKKAPMAEQPAPVPTEKPVVVAEAQNLGDNEVDTDKPATPAPKPRPVETAAAPPPSPAPTPKPAEPEPEPQPQPEPTPAAAPATEVTPEPQPKEEVKLDPAPTAAVTEAVDAEAVKLPDAAPSPESRPQPPKAQTAKAPDRKEAEKPAKETAAKPKSEEKDFDLDQVAALLNKEKPSGGGAKRSTQTASFGGKKTTGAKLSQGEMDALSSQLAGCWSIPAGIVDGEGLRVSVRFNVDASGQLDGRPTIEAPSGNTSFDESAVRAVQKCNRDGLSLPKDKAETWAEVIVNFDPSEMF